MRTPATQYDLYVPKHVTPDQILYMRPSEYTWDDSNAQMNRVHFGQGTFLVMYPNRFANEVSVDAEGIHTLQSWTGEPLPNGHFGSWNEPGDFSRFAYAWILPANIELVDYQANREGTWLFQANNLSFFASNTNDLTFTIRYRQKDEDGDKVIDRHDRCPGTTDGNPVDEHGCPLDSDKDGVSDKTDTCPDTPNNARVDSLGCEIDTDQDGVPDRLDQCADTVNDAKVDERGCEMDADRDGVVDRLDQCPETSAAALVDRKGCELDFDGDGLVNSKDECPHTPPGTKVTPDGCELDSDKDGVVDSADECPQTPQGAQVDASGCQLDDDADGVVNRQDRCPATPSGVAIDETGCELDSDKDGVRDSADQCLQTPVNAIVNSSGCRPDSDGDGVADAADLCPGTGPDEEVDAIGCPQAASIVLEGVNFVSGSAELTEAAKAILDTVAVNLSEHPKLRLEIAGHTDAQGAADFNQALSQKRAEAVLEYLISRGAIADNLSAKGYGEAQPIAGNTSKAGCAKNRRVELNRL